MKLLTNSRMRAFDDCRRLEYMLYEEGVRPVREAEPLRVGTLVHLGLEAWLLAMMIKTAEQDAWLDVAWAAVANRAIDDFEQVRVEEMLYGYHERWQDVPFEVVAAEQQFRAPLVNPQTMRSASRTFDIAGKIDGIVMHEGRVNLLEHKTSSEQIEDLSSSYWTKLAMDPQVSMYYLGAESLGYEVEGCVYDVLKKPGLKPYKATPPEKRKYKKDGSLYANQREEDETPEEYRARVREDIHGNIEKYFQRRQIDRLDSQLVEFMWDCWGKAKYMRDLHRMAGERGLLVVPRNPSACHRYGTCFLWPVCSAGLNPDDFPDRYQRVENVHPELDPDQLEQGENR